MHHSIRKYAQRCSLPRGGELPRGAVSSKDGQPSGERIISGYKQKGGSAMTEAGTGEQGMKGVVFLATIFRFWILLEDPRLP